MRSPGAHRAKGLLDVPTVRAMALVRRGGGDAVQYWKTWAESQDTVSVSGRASERSGARGRSRRVGAGGVVAGKRARTASGSENVTISTWSSTMVDRRAHDTRRARALRAESRVSARALIDCPRVLGPAEFPDIADRERVSNSAVNFEACRPVATTTSHEVDASSSVSYSLSLVPYRTAEPTARSARIASPSRDVVSSRPTGTERLGLVSPPAEATTTTLPAEPTTTRVLRTTTAATKTVHTTTRTITVPPTIPPPVDMALTLPPRGVQSKPSWVDDIFSSLQRSPVPARTLARAPSRVKDRNSRRPTRFDAIHTPVDLPSVPLSSTSRPTPPAKTPPRRPGVLRGSCHESRSTCPCAAVARRWSHLPTDRPPTKNRENARRLETRASEDFGGNARRRRKPRRARRAARRVARAKFFADVAESFGSFRRLRRAFAGSGLPSQPARQRFGASSETSRRVASRRPRFDLAMLRLRPPARGPPRASAVPRRRTRRAIRHDPLRVRRARRRVARARPERSPGRRDPPVARLPRRHLRARTLANRRVRPRHLPHHDRRPPRVEPRPPPVDPDTNPDPVARMLARVGQCDGWGGGPDGAAAAERADACSAAGRRTRPNPSSPTRSISSSLALLLLENSPRRWCPGGGNVHAKGVPSGVPFRTAVERFRGASRRVPKSRRPTTTPGRPTDSDRGIGFGDGSGVGSRRRVRVWGWGLGVCRRRTPPSVSFHQRTKPAGAAGTPFVQGAEPRRPRPPPPPPPPPKVNGRGSLAPLVRANAKGDTNGRVGAPPPPPPPPPRGRLGGGVAAPPGAAVVGPPCEAGGGGGGGGPDASSFARHGATSSNRLPSS